MNFTDGLYIATPNENYEHPRLPPYWNTGEKYGAEVRGNRMYLGSEHGSATYMRDEFPRLETLFSFRSVDNFDEIS